MFTPIRGLIAATLIAGSALVATPALAQDEAESDITISGNASVVSEYRFRGIGLSGGDIAIQGGIDASHSSGFYVGTWGSSLADCGGATPCYGAAELDLYGGWTGEITDGVTADVGVIYYAYPNGTSGADLDYVEFKGTLGFELGPVSTKVGVYYAPDQDSLGGGDNLYISGDLGAGIPGTPISLSAHVGYTDGFLTYTADGNALDWSIGASAAVHEKLSIGVSYIGVQGGNVDGLTDDAIVASLTAKF